MHYLHGYHEAVPLMAPIALFAPIAQSTNRSTAKRRSSPVLQSDEPLIPMPALSLPALRQAVAAVAPSRLPDFFQEIQDAFTQAGDEDSVFPIRRRDRPGGLPRGSRWLIGTGNSPAMTCSTGCHLPQWQRSAKWPRN